ncbi:MAG: hypothetical protein AAFY99_12510, partial [Pseudomonadota bacterium]
MTTSFLFLLVLLGAVGGAVTFGAFDSVLASRANEILNASIPEPFIASTESTQVGFSWPPSLGVQYSGFSISDADADNSLVEIERLSVNLDLIKSLFGRPVFSSLYVVGAKLDAQSLQQSTVMDSRHQVSLAFIAEGFANFGSSLAMVFDVSSEAQAPLKLSINDSRIVIPNSQYSDEIKIDEMQARLTTDRLMIDASLELADQAVQLTGEALRDADQTLAVDLVAEDVVFPVKRLRTFLSNNMDDHEPEASPAPTLIDIALTTRHTVAPQNNELQVTVTPKDLALKLSDDDYVPLEGTARLSYQFDDNSITLERDLWQLGRSSAILSARLRDLPDAQPRLSTQGVMPIEFEVLFNRGRIMPEDSPEAPLTFASRVQGTLDLSRQAIEYTNMELDTSEGYASAEGLIDLANDPPVALFDVSTKEMTIAGLKQLWPGTVAREARRWTLNNLAGGQVLESRFEIAEPLRRRIEGTDRRLEGDSRVSMSVEGVRFDLTGDLPPVRDGSGDILYE